MCMLVFLLTTAFCPPRTGVGGSRRQLSGGRRGSSAGAAGFLSITKGETGRGTRCAAFQAVTVALSGDWSPALSNVMFTVRIFSPLTIRNTEILGLFIKAVEPHKEIAD